jgi:Ser/Thr protein kinase RdoA (MazF antagonist)
MINIFASFSDCDNLVNLVNRLYPVKANQAILHREMIGHVYFLNNENNKYVFKLYRNLKSNDALQTIGILQYLEVNHFPVVSIVPTINGEMNVLMDSPDGICIGILFNYIDGMEPDDRKEIGKIGLQIGRLHNLMEAYPYQLLSRTKMDYIDDYISIMKENGYAPSRIAELEKYGAELWGRIGELPKGFCHGDLHTGNMLRSKTGNYVLFDFDDASGDYPLMDVAYLSDDTNFNVFDEKALIKTKHMFEEFYNGYSKERTLSIAEMNAISDFIAIRHYQIIARIVRCQSLQSLDEYFMNEQYEWLLSWKNLCEKKGNLFK